MGAHMQKGGAEQEPLLVHAGLPRHSHTWLLLKVGIHAILVLFLIFTSFTAFRGVFHGRNEVQSMQNTDLSTKRLIEGIQFFLSYGSHTDSPIGTCICEVVYTHLTSFHHKIHELAVTYPTKVQSFAIYLAEMANFDAAITHFVKPRQAVNGVVSPGMVGMSSHKTHFFTSNSAVSNRLLREARGARRRSRISARAKMLSFMKIVQDLSRESLLQLHHRVLCLDPSAGQKVLALKKRGFNNVEGIDVSPAFSSSNQGGRNTLEETVLDQHFDFAFTSMFDHISDPALFVAEIERTLKVGGFAAMHVSLNAWRSKYIASKSREGVKPVTILFKNSKIVYISTAYAPGLDTLIVFKKMSHAEEVKGANPVAIAAKQPQGDAFLFQSVGLSGSSKKDECRKRVREQHATFTQMLRRTRSLPYVKLDSSFVQSESVSSADDMVVNVVSDLQRVRNLKAGFLRGWNYLAWLSKPMYASRQVFVQQNNAQ